MRPSRRFVLFSAAAAAGLSIAKAGIAGPMRQWTLKSATTPGAPSFNYISLRGGADTQVVEAIFVDGGGEEVLLRLTPNRLLRLLGISTPVEASRLFRGQVNVPDWRMAWARKLAPAQELEGPAVPSAFFNGFPGEQHPVMVREDMLLDDHRDACAQLTGRPKSEFCPPLRRSAEDYAAMNRTELDPNYPIRVEPAEDGMEWRIASHEFPDGGVVDLRYRIETDAFFLDKNHGDLLLQNQLRRDSWRTASNSTRFCLRGESETEYQARLAKNWRLPA